MQHGGKADDRGGFAHAVPHGVLRPVHVRVDRRQGTVVPDGACQHVGHAVLFAAVNDAVVDVLRLDELRHAAVSAHAVDGIQMVIVAVEMVLLGVDILPQRRAQVRALQIVGRQRVARQQPVDVAPRDQFGEGVAGVVVKADRRACHPQDIAVVVLVAQQVVQLVVIPGEGAFAGVALPEGEGLAAAFFLAEAVRVEVDALLAALRSAANHRVALLQVAEFHHGHAPVLYHGYAVHAAFLRQHPFPAELEILRKNAHGVIALRGDPVAGGGYEAGVRRGGKAGFGKIRRGIGFQYERHNDAPNLSDGIRIVPISYQIAAFLSTGTRHTDANTQKNRSAKRARSGFRSFFG